MHPAHARKVLTLLSPIAKNLDEIHSVSGLEDTDLALLEGLTGFAVLLARRMEAKAQGVNIARTVDELQTTAAVLFAIPQTEKVQ